MVNKYDRQCVVCGTKLFPRQIDVLEKLHFPASCSDHQQDVAIELLNNASMWPDGWYGHCTKVSGHDNWEYLPEGSTE